MTRPSSGRLKAANAVCGEACGRGHALWFAPPGAEPVEEVTCRRANAFGPVAGECRRVREAVGLIETSNFAKYEVTGRGAEASLSRLLAGRMPPVGRPTLSPMLNPPCGLPRDFPLGRRSDAARVGHACARTRRDRWSADH